MARTTVRIPDALLRQAKRVAAETGSSLTQVIADALRERLARRDQPKGKRVRLPVFSGQPLGLQPGVDLNDTAALLDLMDATD